MTPPAPPAWQPQVQYCAPPQTPQFIPPPVHQSAPQEQPAPLAPLPQPTSTQKRSKKADRFASLPPPTPPQEGYQLVPQTSDASVPPAKRSSVLRVVLGLVGAVVFVALAAGGIIGGSFIKVAREEYYKLSEDQVPAVALALGQRRKVTSFRTESRNGVRSLKRVYRANGAPADEASAYFTYLQNNDNFVPINDYDFTKSMGSFQLVRPSNKQGSSVNVTVGYDTSGFTVTVQQGPGAVMAPETETAAVQEMPTTLPIDYPAGVQDNPAAQSTLPTAAATGETYYSVGQDQVPSVALALGEGYTLLESKQDTILNLPFEAYFFKPKTEAVTESLLYGAYLTDKAGFKEVTSDFGESRVMHVFAKDSVAEGQKVLVAVTYEDDTFCVAVANAPASMLPN
jgi:hypothetical protein